MGYPSFERLMDFVKYMHKIGYGNKTITTGSLRVKLIKYMKVTTDIVIDNYIKKLEELGHIKKVSNGYTFITEKESIGDFE